MDAVQTPELDRRHEALQPRPVNDVLTEFYDWLASDGIVLARWGEPYEVPVRCPGCPTLAGVREKSLRQRQRDVIHATVGDDSSGEYQYRRSRGGSGPLTGLNRDEWLAYIHDLRQRFPCPECDISAHLEPFGWVLERRVHEDRLALHHESPERLFARFLDLDLNKIDREQRAILEALRAAA